MFEFVYYVCMYVCMYIFIYTSLGLVCKVTPKHTCMGTEGTQMNSSNTFPTSHKKDVGGWVVSTRLRLLYPWERPSTHFTRGVRTQGRSGWLGLSRPYGDSIPKRSSPQGVAIPTMHTRICIYIYLNNMHTYIYRCKHIVLSHISFIICIIRLMLM
jgi:hypothetical protein